MRIELSDGFTLQDWGTAWANGDQDRFLVLADDHDVWVNLRDRFPHPYTWADAESWVSLQAGRDPAVCFAICDGAGPIGDIGLTLREGDLQHSAELGYWLGKPFWGRGIVTAAVKAVTDYGVEAFGLIRIAAWLKTSNGASARVLEKAGYEREGLLRRAVLKAGVPMDYLLYATLRED